MSVQAQRTVSLENPASGNASSNILGSGGWEGCMSESGGSTRYDSVLAPDDQARFVADNMRRIFLLIYRIVGSVPDAQDLTQEAFIKALQRQDQLKDLDKAAHWLSRIASNTAIDFLRRSGRIGFSGLEDLPESAAISALANPEQLVLGTERRERLESSLDILTDRERTALLLRDVEDFSAEEVSAHLNCSKATVRSHIANARVKLRRHFERQAQRKSGRARLNNDDDGQGSLP